MRYIDYDAKTVSAIINSFCHLRINSYEDSDRSVAIVLYDNEYDQINKTLNSNWTIAKGERVRKYLTKSASLTMIMAVLSFVVSIFNINSIELARAFFIVGSSLYISYPVLIFLASLPNSPKEHHALFIESVGDHFDEDDVNKVYEMYKECKNQDEIRKEIIKMIVRKDPAGVKPEFLEWYKDTLQEENKEHEASIKESKKIIEANESELNSLESGNKKPLSSVKKRNQVESEMNQWESALSKL